VRRTWILAAAAVGACQQSSPAQQQQSPAVEANATTQPAQLPVGSKVDQIRIVRADRLPANPKPARVDEACSGYAVAQPKTAAGRLVARSGWIVTSETKLGSYDAITFVGGLDPSTSGTCAHVDGNLGVFDGADLKALAYRRPPKAHGADSGLGVDAVAEDSLGSAEQVDPRRIRLSYGLPGAPFADVVLGDGIAVEPVAAKDQVCGGAAVVPNVFGKDIRQARRALIAEGWLPREASGKGAPPADLVRQGVVEAESCSGTGYAFCSFAYRHRKGFGLRVTSMGEDHAVTRLEPSCSRP
jgi:hypothetical protein